jgi:hypothetical protein
LGRRGLKLLINKLEEEGRLPPDLKAKLREIRKEYGSDELF